MDDGSEQVEELTLEPGTVVRSPRPRALWGVLAAVAVVTGALVVTSAGDDGTQRPGLPVALGSVSGRQEGAMAADSMPVWVTYVAGDDLPALGGEATAYRLSGTVDESQVRALADALGVDGGIVHDGPGWTVSGAGGTLEVYEGGGAQWWYSSASTGAPVTDSGSSSGSARAGGVACAESDDVVVDCDPSTVTTYPACTVSDGPAECVTGECPPDGPCAVAGTACDDAASDCAVPPPTPVDPPVTIACGTEGKLCPDVIGDPPVPPADLPSEDEARGIALELLVVTGLDTDGAVVTVDGPYDAWYVTVEPRVDGVPSGLLANVAVGSDGKVTTAGGYLGAPERLGAYPVLDTRAAIDRANAQQVDGSAYRGGVAMDTAVGTAEASGGDEDPPVECEACDPIDDAPVSTVIACPEEEPGCGTTGGVVDEPVTTTVVPRCKVQADGSEICEFEPGITCPQAAPPADDPLGTPETLECTPPLPEPGVVPEPLPEPQPIEITLVDAEPALVLLPATDGSADAYLVPAYRFTDADGGRVDLPAVADEALTTPPTTDTVEPPVTPTVAPQPCGEPLVEADASGSTHTVQPNRDCVDPDPQTLEEGQEPEIGVGYYADVDTECEALRLGDTVWILDEGDLTGWADPGERHEGGTFTLDSPEHGTFVGDYQGITTATFRLPTATEQIANCDPVPRG